MTHFTNEINMKASVIFLHGMSCKSKFNTSFFKDIENKISIMKHAKMNKK